MPDGRHAANGKSCLCTYRRRISAAQILASDMGGFVGVDLVATSSHKQNTALRPLKNDALGDLVQGAAHGVSRLLGGARFSGHLDGVCVDIGVQKDARDTFKAFAHGGIGPVDVGRRKGKSLGMMFLSRLTRAPRAYAPDIAADCLAQLPVPAEARALVSGAAGCSPFLSRLMLREAAWLESVWDTPPEVTLDAVLDRVAHLPLVDVGTGLRQAKRQVALLSSRSVVFEPKKDNRLDMAMLVFCGCIAVIIFMMIGMAQYGALVKFWPYNLSMTLKHYSFEVAGLGWESFYNSVRLAFYTAVFGTVIIFVGAYIVEKLRTQEKLRGILQLFALLPMAVPGLVLGLAYIFYFNASANPLGFIYATMAILVINTVVHFYTVSHLTAVTALKQMDKEFEAVSLSLKVPVFKMFWRVTIPVCLPTILDISIYLFVNAMTTVSGVIFLYTYDTTLASVSAIHLDEQGDVAGAAAMAMLIVYVSVFVRVLHTIVTKGILWKTQAWRHRSLLT